MTIYTFISLIIVLIQGVFCIEVIEEVVEDLPYGDANIRIAREPFNLRKNQNSYRPPVFDYQNAKQQDQRRHRYAQQQLSDMRNIYKRSNQIFKPKSSIISRKLKPESFFEDADFESLKTHLEIDRQDNNDNNNQIIYINPKAQQDLESLNSLLGQSPDNQLAGLKKLLEAPQQQNYILPPIKGPHPFQAKDHTPIKEDTVDVPHSSVKSHQALQAIQAKLDEVAKLQAQKALEQAQREAEAQVAAQHAAIASAEEAARREAYAKIAAQNGERMSAQDSKSVDYFAQQNEAILRAQAERDAHEQVQKALLLAQKEADKARLKKISITQSFTKAALGRPKLVALETQKEDVDDHQHQYAARYAFGYRIRDGKMGNDFGHEEKREGKSAKGHYHVLLPDGRLQKVEYYADPSGYHAKVTYENVAHHHY